MLNPNSCTQEQFCDMFVMLLCTIHFQCMVRICYRYFKCLPIHHNDHQSLYARSKFIDKTYLLFKSLNLFFNSCKFISHFFLLCLVTFAIFSFSSKVISINSQLLFQHFNLIDHLWGDILVVGCGPRPGGWASGRCCGRSSSWQGSCTHQRGMWRWRFHRGVLACWRLLVLQWLNQKKEQNVIIPISS